MAVAGRHGTYALTETPGRSWQEVPDYQAGSFIR